MPDKQPDDRLTRISALTLEQARRALHYLAGYTPAGFDEALDMALLEKFEPVLCATCGDSETELEPVVVITLADGSARTEYYCRDYVACQDRRHPDLVKTIEQLAARPCPRCGATTGLSALGFCLNTGACGRRAQARDRIAGVL